MVDDNDVPRLYAELLNPAHYTFDERSLLSFAAAVAAAVVGIFIVRWERGSRPAQFFAAFCLLFLLWGVCRGLSLMLVDPDLMLFLSRRTYVLLSLALPALYQFVMMMLRLEARRLPLIRLHWILGIAVAVASFMTPWVMNGVVLYPWGYEPLFGPLGIASVFWVSAMMLSTGFDAWRAWRQAPADRIERRRLRSFAIALAVLFLAFVDFLPGLGVPVFPLASLPTTAFALLTARLTHKYGLVEITPALAAQEIADRVRGALLMLDREGVVQWANRQCASILGLPEYRLLGRRASAVLGESFEPSRLSALARAEARDLEKEWTHVNPLSDQPRDLAMSAFVLRDAHEREIAYGVLLRDVTEQKRAEEERRAEALRDGLTGLPNRVMFLSQLDAAIERRRSEAGYQYAVCFLNMHRTRVINEDLGTAAGDRVLVEAVRRLREVVRPQDALARVGGDEFAVLVRGIAGRTDVQAYAEALRRALRAPFTLADHELLLSASIGLATSERSYAAGAELLRDASVAMYRAKESASGIEFIGARGIAGRRTRTEAELRAAVDSGQLEVFYQPVVDLGRRQVAGFEALVRWRHPARGIVKPDDFLPLAQEVGLMTAIDERVLQRACRDLYEFQRQSGNAALTVSVNLTEATLLQPGIIARMVECATRNHLEPGDLRVELLERVVLLDPLQDALRQLRASGLGLYIDDFGTGHSALSRLHQAPLTALKIDRAFVSAMSKGEGGEKTINAILSLARNLGLEAIAEGACTAEEVRRLQQAGCRHVQGFFFAEALPFEGALAWARQPEKLAQRFAQLSGQEPGLPRAAAS